MDKKAWLTINRVCNFRCEWCYARNTEYQEDMTMSLDLAEKIIDLLAEIGIKDITLTGGEPTYHKDFFKIVEYISSKNIVPATVTNGYRFHDMDFVEKIKGSPLARLSVSLKAGNSKQYKDLTGIDAYDTIIQSINNIKSLDKKRVSYSITISKYLIDNIEEIAKMLSDVNSDVSILFCAPSFDGQRKACSDHMCVPRELVEKIAEKYSSLYAVLGDRLKIAQSLPLCIWPKEIRDALNKKRQDSFGCPNLIRSNITIGVDGSIYLCNDLLDFPIGKFGVDFTNKQEFEEFWDRPDVVELFDKFCVYPLDKCVNCADNDKCIGGCPLNWFVFDPKEVIDA